MISPEVLRPAEEADDMSCTEPNRDDCPRHCQSFCNKAEEAKAVDGLPTWGDAEAEIAADNGTPIDVFIYEQEPDAPHDVRFRQQLKEALDYAAACARPPAEKAGDLSDEAKANAELNAILAQYPPESWAVRNRAFEEAAALWDSDSGKESHISAAIRALKSDKQPAIGAGSLSERDAFESHSVSQYGDRAGKAYTSSTKGHYHYSFIQHDWTVWQAARRTASGGAGDISDEPTMLWDAEDAENCYGDGPEDFANNYASNCMIGGDACEVDVLCAYRGSTRTMRIELAKNPHDEELKKPVSWSWVDSPAANGAAAQKGGA